MSVARRCKLCSGVLFAYLFCCAQADSGPSAARSDTDAQRFELRTTCPVGWELMNSGGCELRTLYQLYSSAPGFGGLRVPLPPMRDDFSPKQIDLGRLLFFDPVLSADGSLSCAHCHHPDHAFSDGLGRSVGRGGQGWAQHRTGGIMQARGAPSLWNVGFLQRLFWDGRADSLEHQAEGPLFAPDEMANTAAHLEQTLSANPIYRRLFGEAFNAPTDARVTAAMVERALAAFESCLVSLDSRYDHYAHGDENALNEQEKRGHNLFRSFTMRCSQCHTPPLFTNGELAVTGTPEPDGLPFDPGAGAINPAPELRGAFRIPSLRNVALTAPYMHSGRYATLREVIEFYNDRRGHAAPAEEHLLIHWHIALPGKELDASQVDDLVAFLETLTDESHLPPIPARVPSGLPVVGREPYLTERSTRP